MTKIKKTLAADNKRLDFLPHYCGKYFMQYEGAIYDRLRQASPDYDGGYWEYYTLSNGGFYMELQQSGRLELECIDNYYHGKMSVEAASIAINLCIQNDFAWQVNPEKHSVHFHSLRDFALNHPEAREILRFID